jgi:hypothetical protein
VLPVGGAAALLYIAVKSVIGFTGASLWSMVGIAHLGLALMTIAAVFYRSPVLPAAAGGLSSGKRQRVTGGSGTRCCGHLSSGCTITLRFALRLTWKKVTRAYLRPEWQ